LTGAAAVPTMVGAAVRTGVTRQLRDVRGDRKAGCPGGMEPIAVTVRGERRWMLIHRCTHCGRLRMNRAAADDNVLLLMQLAALPLGTTPIPVPGPADPPAPGFTSSDRDRARRPSREAPPSG
jgi:hypothetical protein